MTEQVQDKPPFVELLDLRSVTREADRFTTTVRVKDPRTLRWYTWILAGLADLRNEGNQQFLRIRLDYGVTDGDHSSAIAVNIDLIGLSLGSIHNGGLDAKAWISTTSPFNIPSPGYDPVKADDMELCTWCDDPHPIVEYLPAEDLELWRKLRGLEVQIIFNPQSDMETRSIT